MNRSLPSMLALIPLVLLLGLYMFFFKVRESEVAVVRTFGRIAQPDEQTGAGGGIITEPGPRFRWPWPIQSVTVYDHRLQVTRPPADETPTQDGKPIIVGLTSGWKIDEKNVYKFSVRCSDIDDAETKLSSLVRSDMKSVIGNYQFSNFVSIDENELRYDKIEQDIFATVQPKALNLYGIDLKYVKIDQLALPEQITEDVFNAMKSERQAEAARITTEGESRAKQIRAEAESIANTILSFADRVAKEIEAKGIERAAEYNETFRQDEALAVLLLKAQYLPRILKDRTTLVLDQNSPLVNLLTGLVGDKASVEGPTAPQSNGQNIAKAPAPPELLEQK